MRLFCLLLLVPLPLAAQEGASRWSLGLAVTRDAFSGGSSDTTSVSGTTLEVLPAPRSAYEVSLSRTGRRIEAGVSLGYAPGDLRGRAGAVSIDDGTSGVARYRAGFRAGYRLGDLGPASLWLQGFPALDHWESDGVGSRTTLSVHGGLALRVPLGRVDWENRASFGIGGSPFREEDLPATTRVRALKTWSVGAGLRWRW